MSLLSTFYGYPFLGLYAIIDEQAQHNLSLIIHTYKTKSDLVTYLHTCCFFPVMSTFELSIQKGDFSFWPDLTSTVVKNIYL